MDAVIFDLDGTIADSEWAHGEALHAVLAPLGVTLTPDQYVGVGDRTLLQRVLAGIGRTEDHHLRDALRGKSDAYQSIVASGRVQPYPGIPELIDALADLALPLAVCTAAMRDDAHAALRAFDLFDRFHAVVTADDVERNKPAPDGYLLAANRLGVRADRAVVVEDSPTGVRAAHAAGATVVALGHSTPRDQLQPPAHAFADRADMLTPDALAAHARRRA